MRICDKCEKPKSKLAQCSVTLQGTVVKDGIDLCRSCEKESNDIFLHWLHEE